MRVVSAKPLSWTMNPARVGPTKLPSAKADIQMPDGRDGEDAGGHKNKEVIEVDGDTHTHTHGETSFFWGGIPFLKIYLSSSTSSTCRIS